MLRIPLSLRLVASKSLSLRCIATNPKKDDSEDLFEKQREIKRLHGITTSHVEKEQDKMRDWKGHISFKDADQHQESAQVS